MALNLTLLENSLLNIVENTPDNVPEYIDLLVDSFHNYASQVVPLSSTSEAARQAMKSAIPSIPRLENAYIIYANILATGMVGSGYNGTPPSGILLFNSIIPFALNGDRVSSTKSMALLIHTWMQTGIATMIATPNTVIPWS